MDQAIEGRLAYIPVSEHCKVLLIVASGFFLSSIISRVVRVKINGYSKCEVNMWIEGSLHQCWPNATFLLKSNPRSFTGY